MIKPTLHTKPRHTLTLEWFKRQDLDNLRDAAKASSLPFATWAKRTLAREANSPERK